MTSYIILPPIVRLLQYLAGRRKMVYRRLHITHRSKSKREVEFIYGGRPFSEVVIKAQIDWSRDGRTSSCNAAQLRHFLVSYVSDIMMRTNDS